MDNKMNTFYIVEVIKMPLTIGVHTESYAYAQVLKSPSVVWVGTYNDLDAAEAHAEKEKESDYVVGVFIIEWSGVTEKLETGSYSTRQCSLGAVIDSVPYFFERAYSIKSKAVGPTRCIYCKVGEWEKLECPTKNYRVGGGNWLTWSPTLSLK